MDDELNPQQTEDVITFQDLTGIEDFERCKRILSQHNWNLERAVGTSLDNLDNSGSAATSSSSAQSSASQETDRGLNENNNNQEAETGNQPLALWSLITRIINLPFYLVYDTVFSILRFAWSLIRPDPRRYVTNPLGDVISFIESYELEYGSQHPVFYRGPYGDALTDAKRELKFLLVYLHCETHHETRNFCANVLANPQVIEFINTNNLLFWACSVSRPEGYRVSQALRENTYPHLALVVLKNNRMTVVDRIEGPQTVDGLLTKLRRAISENEGSLITVRLEREERMMNQLLRAQQDEAFEESLRADQEKERKKLEERTKKEAEEKEKKEREMAELQRKERLMQLKIDLVDKIPPEIEAGHVNATKIVIKLPNGTRLERRFDKTLSIKYLYYFVFCHDQSPLHFQIRTNFPTRDLPGRPPTLDEFEDGKLIDDQNTATPQDPPTFEECDLGKGAMLFVHDLEA